MKYYLNGKRVGCTRARGVFIDILQVKGIPFVDAWAAWIHRASEEARNRIFDLTDGKIKIVEQ